MENKMYAQVSFYKNIKDTRPKDANLHLLLTGETYKNQILAIRKERDPEKQKELKNKLPLFTPSGLFSASGANSLIKSTGLLCIDIDGKDNEAADNFDGLKRLITAVPYVLYCGASVRGNGYFCIIPISRPDRHKQHFRSLQEDFSRCGVVIDKSCSDISRKRFVSYDPCPYLNPDAKTYKYIKEPQRVRRELWSSAELSGQTAARVADAISVICDRGIDITGGYPQWFEIACALANEFGESGREILHRVSQFGDYDPEYTDFKFDEALKSDGYGYRIGTFFHYVKQAGAFDVDKRGTVDPHEVFKDYLK